MLPVPPSSTLFPYTTLFRSQQFLRGGERLRPALGQRPGPRLGRRQEPVRGDDLVDRKSTRLNSSHRCISYAVFCLKKKKKKTTRTEVHQTLIPPTKHTHKHT